MLKVRMFLATGRIVCFLSNKIGFSIIAPELGECSKWSYVKSPHYWIEL